MLAKNYSEQRAIAQSMVEDHAPDFLEQPEKLAKTSLDNMIRSESISGIRDSGFNENTGFQLITLNKDDESDENGQNM